MVQPIQLAAKIYQDLVWHISGKDNQVFITFDDGPTPEITPWVLSILREYNAKATFFCVGKNVKENPDLYWQIIDEGHSVGNHTFDHLKGWTVGFSGYYDNIRKASQFINSNLFRPPYGKIMPGQIKEVKKEFKIVMWDVLSKDYDPRVSPDKCYNNVIKLAHSGSIIVFHDTLKAEKNLKYTLPKVLDYFKRKEFNFYSIEYKQYKES